ncbi:MAG: cytidylate kinase [Bacteroidetes bacterium RIFOXYA12_FULL_35_11]|nr:MAG: cytidylate kinase [Bacteroidetes bacterium GWF2_35_48]OFY74044.1 MAG: cytidylate kinase [Bacteroidetes bacterium RIFOXYA12_FULL_35_11]OFY97749.1 MAG: cytidylate kinase [Bacteroidetes bacterium RIFOXYB2_FULL_35_7]HBX53018.1 (d)CMP kinase [Bacteroidales bacterium]
MLTLKKDIIIAIDGYSSCGKSTLAKSLAGILKYTYIDSGAMYRAVTLYGLRNNYVRTGFVDTDKMIQNISNVKIEFRLNEETLRNELWLNGENVEDEIRGMEVANNVSPVSTIAEVRKRMVFLQQEMGKNKSIVMDGRDIGTVVFPEAELKFFVTADVDVRAQRRYKEFKEKNIPITIEEIKENIGQRDHIDATRKESPLRRAEDAVILDNSNLSREGQLEWAINYIKEHFSS